MCKAHARDHLKPHPGRVAGAKLLIGIGLHQVKRHCSVKKHVSKLKELRSQPTIQAALASHQSTQCFHDQVTCAELYFARFITDKCNVYHLCVFSCAWVLWCIKIKMYYDKYQAKMLSFKQKHDPYQAKICLEVGKYAPTVAELLQNWGEMWGARLRRFAISCDHDNVKQGIEVSLCALQTLNFSYTDTISIWYVTGDWSETLPLPHSANI